MHAISNVDNGRIDNVAFHVWLMNDKVRSTIVGLSSSVSTEAHEDIL